MRITLRAGKADDVGYAIATWSRSVSVSGIRDRRALVPHMRRALERTLAGAGKFMVACSDEDQDALVGWALSEGGDLWWVYVAKDFRSDESGLHLGRLLEASVLVSSVGKSRASHPQHGE